MEHAFKVDLTIGRAVRNEPDNIWATIEGCGWLPLFFPERREQGGQAATT